MDFLISRGINVDLNAAELERCIALKLPGDAIVTMRDALFAEAREANLISEGDALVQRRKTNGGRSVRQKLVSDIQQLVCSIRSKATVPRTLLKNGKRSKAELRVSQARHSQSERATIHTANFLGSDSTNHDAVPDVHTSGDAANTHDTVFRSTVVNDIGLLKTTVDALKQDIQALKGQLGSRTSDDCDTCLLYVRFKLPTSETLNKTLLESKLCTTVISYDVVRVLPTPALRVKIGKSLLHNAITHARANGCVADIWGGTPGSSLSRAARTPDATQSMASEQHVMKITCWNCRGLSSSIPYVNHLMDSGSDIVVLSEHWLWPYELHKLNEIHPGYQGLGRADARLTDSSDIPHRGCGGVGIVWKKSLDVTPMTDIESSVAFA